MENINARVSCRMCGSKNLYVYLDLGSSPLANSYVLESDRSLPEFKAPLAIQLCEDCGLSQLTHVVNPELMFSHYLYVSSTPQTFRNHCDDFAVDSKSRLKNKQDDLLCLDIASNDGCLLRSFRKNGFSIVGVDPARNLAKEANEAGIPTLCAYWSEIVAQEIMNDYGKPSVITATNVFAHVDDVHSFVRAVQTCLQTDGLFVLEFPYLLNFIHSNAFDTAYHEHLSYVALSPVMQLLEKYNMEVIDRVLFPSIHGGTIRVISAHKGRYPVSSHVRQQVEVEAEFGLKKRETYDAFAARVFEIKKELVSLLEESSAHGKTIWAYGASAKGNTLLNFFGIDSKLVKKIIDDNPKKWGLLTPGTGIPITGIHELKEKPSQVDDLLLLAWNFGQEIISRSQTVGYRGNYLFPVPKPKKVKNFSEQGAQCQL